jgi:hypothetical protein
MAAERFVGGISPNIAAVDTRKLVANATISSWQSSVLETGIPYVCTVPTDGSKTPKARLTHYHF